MIAGFLVTAALFSIGLGFAAYTAEPQEVEYQPIDRGRWGDE